MPLTFGIDYDDTFTAAPELISAFVLDAESRGHRVILVTARRETEDSLLDIRECLASFGCRLPIVFTHLGSKLEAVKKRNIKVDIWMDDNPEALVHGH